MFYHSQLLAPLVTLAESHPEQVLLFSEKERITARELIDQSKVLAYNLQVNGFRENDVAVIAVKPGIDFLKIIYATIILRGKVAIIDPEMGRDNYLSKLRQLNPKWAFVDTRLLFLQEHPVLRYLVSKLNKHIPYFPYNKKITTIAVGRSLPLMRKHIYLKKLLLNKKSIALEKNNSNHKYLIVYTSGTLAEPKGVVHSFQSVNQSLMLLATILKEDQNCIMGTYLPHFMLLGISLNRPVYIYDPATPPSKKLDTIIKNNIGILFGPPSDFLPLIEYCEQHAVKLPASLKHILLGSAPIHKNFIHRLIAVAEESLKITCLYGMTELLMVAKIDGHKKIHYSGKGDVVGELFPGIQAEIAEDGEILLQSEQLFEHYFHDQTRPEYHATGDLGMLDVNNGLVLTGRKKDMIIRRNMNIYPAIYETTIKNIKGINDAALIGIWNENKQEEDVYLAVEGEQINSKALMEKLRNGKYSIDKEAIPDKIIFIQLPRKGRQNKIDRNSLRQIIKDNYL